MSPKKRLETLQFLRKVYSKIRAKDKDEDRKRLRDLLRLSNKHKVKYCIIGAFATAFYALPRYTKT